jgi:hypothetical protein
VSKNKQLVREVWRASVFGRDRNRCVMCNNPAVDVHHIIDRSAFEDGGYDINNGVSLCERHHLEAEQGSITPSQLRLKAKIRTLVLPAGVDPAKEYDKWCRVIKNSTDFPTDITLNRQLTEDEICELTDNGRSTLHALVAIDLYDLSGGGLDEMINNAIVPGDVDETLDDIEYAVWDCVFGTTTGRYGTGYVIIHVEADAEDVVNAIHEAEGW